MTAYHSKMNGQVERFSRTILHGLPAFAGEQHEICPKFVGTVASLYSTQIHSSAPIAPFDLVLHEPTSPLILQCITSFGGAPTHRHRDVQFRANIRALFEEARTSLSESQNRCKSNFNSRMRSVAPIHTSYDVYIERAGPQDDDSSNRR